MPGILGTLSSSLSLTLFKRQIRILNHFDYRTIEKNLPHYYSAALGLPFSNFEFFPYKDRYLLTFFGDIFDRPDSLRKKFYSELILSIIKKDLEYLARLNGQFQLALYDREQNCLYLVTDKVGSRPLYYFYSKDNFSYSCEIKSLLQDKNIPRDLNYQAIGDLFSFGYVALKNTLFKNIKNLGAASLLSYKNNQITIETYYTLPYDESSLSKKRFGNNELDRYIEESYDKLHTAVKRQIDKKTIFIPLSGGLDSRFISAIAQTYLPAHFTTYTFGNARSDDILIAREVSKILQSRHLEFMIDPLKLWHFGKRFSYLSDHMSMINGPIQAIDAINALKGEEQVLLAAQAADVMWGSTLKNRALKRILSVDSVREDNLYLFHNMFHKIKKYERDILFKPDFLQTINLGFSVFKEYFSLGFGRHPFYLYQLILYFEYARRGIFGGNLMNNFFFDMRMPSFDRDLLDFVAVLPMRLRKDQFIYQKTMSKFFPELANIRCTTTGLPVSSPSFLKKATKLETQVVYRIKKSSLSPLLSPFKRYQKKGYVNYKDWFKNQLNEPLKEVLFDPATLNRPFYNKNGIKKLYDLHMNTAADYSLILWQIVNLEYFFRMHT